MSLLQDETLAAFKPPVVDVRSVGAKIGHDDLVCVLVPGNLTVFLA